MTSTSVDAADAADAVVVVTPEYNHSYPGPLKTAIDAVREPWRAKPVATHQLLWWADAVRAAKARTPYPAG